jgi:TfoX/Sxy family transcriptional regulator of competence genes
VSTSAETAAFIEDQAHGLDIRLGRMFGEYGVYIDGKITAFICDDTLFLKPSEADPAVLAGTFPGVPFPGAKLYVQVPGELLEDREWLTAALQATADALPAPKPKTPKAQQPKAPRRSAPRSAGSGR